jgi:transposase
VAHFFREPDRRQRFLLPVDMMDWLPEGDIVHLIIDAVGVMDLSGFEAAYQVGKAGQAPFAPRGLLARLIYAYCHGISAHVGSSSGGAGYRFIVGAGIPDHTVIARFRQRQVDRMKDVFVQVLELCREAGVPLLKGVLLQSSGEGKDASVSGCSQAATPNSAFTKAAWATMSLPPTPFTCPFLIIARVS